MKQKIQPFLQTLFLTFGVISLLALFSCEKSPVHENKRVKQVRLNLSSEPPTLDPRKGGDVISSYMHFMLFEGLTRLNHDRSIAMAQAKSVDISPDGKIYTFHMRGTRWSNGDPVTAFDFEKAWKDILDPKFPSVNAQLLYPIKNAESAKRGLVPLSEVGIEAKDANTFVVTLDRPTPYFLDLTSFCVLFPVHSGIDLKNPDWAYSVGKDFVSNGPYILKDWKHNHELVVTRNLNYWSQERVAADSIRFSMVDNENTALQMFENRELDMVGHPLSPLPVDALPALHKAGKLKRHPIAGTTMIAFNVNQFPFNNAKVRKAFAYAINRAEITENITQLNERIATGIVPPILKKEAPDLFPDADMEQARSLLAEGLKELGVSFENLETITYYYISSDLNHKLAQVIQQQWAKELGVKIKIENCERKTFIDRLTRRDFSIAQHVWIAQYSDQMSILERFKFKNNAKNYSCWENSDYIDLLDRSAYETQDARYATLERAEKLLIEEMPIAPIFHWDFAYLVQPYLKGVGISPIGDIYFENLKIEHTP